MNGSVSRDISFSYLLQFEMFLDELPIWGYIGDSEEEDLVLGHTASSKHYLYTHLHFRIAYNGDSVIALNVTTDPLKKVDITAGAPLNVRFSYSVSWVATKTSFHDRMKSFHRVRTAPCKLAVCACVCVSIANRQRRAQFLPATLEIHWLSIINILVLVLLLTAFLAVILMRVVKNDFTRYMRADDDDAGFSDEEETGWKLVHGDVFRFPSHVRAFDVAARLSISPL